MNAESMSFKKTNFQSTPHYEPGRLTVRLEGEGDLDATSVIHAVLTGVHAEAQRLGVKEVIIDLTNLEFLNSSGIKHFVSWVRAASLLPSESAYAIRLDSSPVIGWQRRSLNALQGFAPKVVKIHTAAVGS